MNTQLTFYCRYSVDIRAGVQKHEARVFVVPSDIDISGDWEENVPVMKQLPLELCESGYADSCGEAVAATS